MRCIKYIVAGAGSTPYKNTGPGGLLLHKDVINQVGEYMGSNGSLVARLIELARVCVIEIGDGGFCLRCVDAAMAACPPDQRKELHELLWVEGLGCFYAGEWERGAKHFEAEMEVNGNDVEVPVWRWLCDAHNPGIGVKEARKRLLPLRSIDSNGSNACSDPRGPPFNAIWSLYKGDGSIQAVLEAANAAGSADAMMWGSFYVGLYLEALGQHERAREQFENAAVADSHNNIAQLAKTHLRKVREIAAQREWSDLTAALASRRRSHRDQGH